MTESLNPLTLLLRGSALIEASAGTGKTWTLAALMLRLVLGHGDVVQREGRPLMPAEILVMTFTRAATRELSQRIRERLVEAAAVFRGSRQPHAEDLYLHELLCGYAPGPARELAAWRLESAAQGMDEAAIHTLDAWCQRVLREQAFDSAEPLESEVLPDSHALRLEAARDVWRQEVYPLEAPALEAIQQTWATPDEMARDAQLAAEKPLPVLAPSITLSSIVSSSISDLAPLKDGWVERTDDMERWLVPLLKPETTPFKQNLINESKLRDWLDALRRWALDPVAERPGLTDAAGRRLTPRGLIDAVKAKHSLSTPPECFDAFELLMTALRDLHSREPLLRAYAAGRVEARLQQIKLQRQLHSHADMQRRLHDALDPQINPEGAQRLRERILRQYPVALVDEFQDTSPLQLRVLDRLYRLNDNDPQRLLLLIGDPKQSIYAFRGADIHSYLQARAATSGRHYALDKNFRSTASVVSVINSIFAAAEARPGEGAFRFGQEAGGHGQRLPFVSVQAHGRAERLLSGGQAVPALTLCVDTALRSSTEAKQAYAARCAQAIVQWLAEGGSRFAVSDTTQQPLRPADVAVLVRNHQEAALVRQAMADRGLPSVFLSDRDSVLQTAQARDLLRLMQAVAAPRDSRLSRAALATELLGLSLAQLQTLADDDEAFEVQAARLAALLPVWQGQGILAMVRALLHGFALPARWLQQADGERRLTNLLHLGELVQAATQQHERPSAQVRWLAQQVDDPLADAARSEDRVLRLESDADRVQVVTVHKSKGLEYPVVFLPFASHVRDNNRGRPWALWLVDDDGQRRIVLEPDADDRAQAEREQQREDVRLLYVALTRARHALWVGASMHTMGNAKDCAWHRSALGYLLTGPTQQEPGSLVPALKDLAVACPAIHLELVTPSTDAALQAAQIWVAARPAAALLAPRVATVNFDRLWSVSSYSSLVRDAEGPGSMGHAQGESGQATQASRLAGPERAGGPDEPGLWPSALHVHQDEPDVPEPAPWAQPADASTAAWHRFPRGALAGNFLHDQLEWLAGEGFVLDQSLPLQQALARRCERQAWGHRADDVQQWLSRVCTQVLPPLRAPLHSLRARVPELEFWLPSDGMDTAALDRLCHEHVFPGKARPALVGRQLRGLLMGFADLVFEHQGRYWVLDYKSNALGEDDSAYSQAAMEHAMLAHRYDVQAVLYLLPLHRLLRARLGVAYEPQRQLGGAIYFFLRGVNAASAGCLSLQPPWALLDQLDAMLGCGEAGARP